MVDRRSPSPEVEAAIFQHVARDLEPSWLTVHTKVAAAAVFGGLLSLLVCGQFGLGLTSVADAFTERMHSSMGALPCALICGTLFAVFPVTILRLVLCGPLQFKAILRRRWWALPLWFGGFGGAMAYLGHHGNDALSFAGWVVGALLTTNLLARLLERLVPVFELRSSSAPTFPA